MQYKCLYIYIYIFFSSACVFNVVIISIRNCFNKNNIMLISYIFSTLLRNVEDFMCRMYDVVAFFAIGTVNVQAGVSEVG